MSDECREIMQRRGEDRLRYIVRQKSFHLNVPCRSFDGNCKQFLISGTIVDDQNFHAIPECGFL